MGLNFPTAPTLNQLYPQPAVAGVPVYKWDGEKWVSALSSAANTTNMITTGGQNITGGFSLQSFPIGNFPASFTPDPLKGNYQFGTNNAAFTLNAPAIDSAIDILVANGASAGVITFSGFTIGANVGDTLTATNGNRFLISMRRIGGIATYLIKALQ